MDATRQAGIDFRHQDGLLDPYLVNGAETAAFKLSKPTHSALYRNNGDSTFTDGTASAHVGADKGLFFAIGPPLNRTHGLPPGCMHSRRNK